jgi:hypothetical protein
MSITKPRTKKQNHYVDNKKFYTVLLHFKRECEEAKLNNTKKPPIPKYIGECLYMIATRLSYKPNFVNYTYRDEMVSDGLENCICYLDNFNPDKYDNPFAYFTQIIYYAFLRRIDKEKKHLYIKQKTLENFYFEGMLAEQATNDDNKTVSVNLDNEYMQGLVESFDKKQAEKQQKARAKKKEILEKLYDNDQGQDAPDPTASN